MHLKSRGSTKLRHLHKGGDYGRRRTGGAKARGSKGNRVYGASYCWRLAIINNSRSPADEGLYFLIFKTAPKTNPDIRRGFFIVISESFF
jgi:hypothetical protein